MAAKALSSERIHQHYIETTAVHVVQKCLFRFIDRVLDIPVVPQRAVEGSESPKVQWKRAVHRRSGGRSNGCTKSRFHDLEFLRVHKTVSVPQALETDRAVDVSVVTQSQDSISWRVQTAVLAPSTKRREILSVPQRASSPQCSQRHSVVTQRQMPTIQKIQKTVEILQVQFEDEVVDVNVAIHDRCL